ncbi:MAG: peptidyl-prolyl cis-trans isomerase [Myxococcales bacterium]|nr:MAG: peptidyl-prolyl cis-trans isomerase [Myxococcales bacterium]
MSWKRAALIVLAVVGTIGSGGCSKKVEDTPTQEEWPKHGLTEAQANEVLAKVGDRTITVGEFADRLASQSPYLRARFESPERRKEFLDNLVRFELLVYEAKRRGYADRPEIARARRNGMIQQLVKKEVDEPLGAVEITDEEIQAVYEANPTEFDRPAQVRASHIFIKDRGRALTVLAKAKNADLAGFRKLAREESEDDKTKSDGGDLRFFEADAEGPPPAAVRDAAFSLDKVGAVYPDLVEEGDGYHIIMLTGKRAALKRTYEQAKRAIRHKLARERKDAAMEALTERLRKEVDVEVDYEALEDVEVDIPDFPQGP